MPRYTCTHYYIILYRKIWRIPSLTPHPRKVYLSKIIQILLSTYTGLRIWNTSEKITYQLDQVF